MSPDEPTASRATGMFDRMYDAAGRDAAGVPWAGLAPDPHVVAWLDTIGRAPGRAVVVGSGLGDDAEELAGRGWMVTAFDVAPTALAWARERFPRSSVDYRLADVLDLPAHWAAAFDLVVEVRTIQSVPPGQRARVVSAIAGLVAPGGELILVANVRPEGTTPTGPPWRVAPSELLGFEKAGLERTGAWEPAGHVVAAYRRS